MAKKKVTAVIKLQCPAQKATPAPPIGPALGPHGVSAPQFVQQFNDTQLTEIAQTKLPDLNAYDIEAAKKIIAGTARSMGVEVEK